VEDVLDGVGLAILVLAVGWTVVAWGVAGGNPVPVAATMMLAAGAVVLGRILVVSGQPLAPALVVGLALLLAVVQAPDLVSSEGGRGPLGYVHAKGQFYLQAAVGAMLVTVRWHSSRIRIAGIAAAVAFGVVAALSSNIVALLMVALAPALVLAFMGRRGSRPAVALCALMVVGMAALTVRFAVRPEREAISQIERAIGGRLDERIPLWREAFAAMRVHPAVGVGPGRLTSASPTAASDPDLRWAHHGFLHQGAEGGVPALVLLGLAFLWGFARLWAAPQRDAGTGLGAVALAALGMHVSLDYVLHFPVLVASAATMVGAAVPARRPIEALTLARKLAKAVVLPAGLLRRRRPGDLVVLLYHRVGAGRGEIALSPQRFEEQMAELARGGGVIHLDEALADGRPGGVVVTVDDGFRDFYEQVLPMLVRFRIPATLYLATGLVEGQIRAGPQALTWSQLEEIVASGLVSMGSHTHAHANLARASRREAEGEMRRSKDLIEDRLGVPCRHFSFPWGVASPDADKVARRLFDSAAVTWRTNRRDSFEPYRLGRIPILRSDGAVFFRAKVGGMMDGEAMVYRLVRRGPWRSR
jgi:peptidoglycan/xylan/chitin deacetylase (PgdA/CDA1 family)/O-antigen ligase